MIYSFRYRDGVRGVVTRHTEADSLPEAEAIAIQWVQRKPGALYIANSTEAWLVTLTDLPVASEAPVAEQTPAKPSAKEQREKLTEQGAARRAGNGVGADEKQTARVGA
jgi:hypothetical protein